MARGSEKKESVKKGDSSDDEEIPEFVLANLVDKIRFKDGDDQLKKVSKVVSWILRHSEETHIKLPIKLSEEKSVKVMDLLKITRKICGVETYPELVELLAESNNVK